MNVPRQPPADGPLQVLDAAPRPMRADAVKNRDAILAAAEEAFAVDGLTVPVDAIAVRAGVGTGTLYRHFPTKEALYEAVVAVHLAKLLDTAKECSQRVDPGEALFSFLRHFSAQMYAKRDLIEAMSAAGIDFKSQCGALIDEFKQRVDTLLQRAIASGEVRGDLTAEDVLGLISGACHTSGQNATGEAGLGRMVDVVIDGLRLSR